MNSRTPAGGRLVASKRSQVPAERFAQASTATGMLGVPVMGEENGVVEEGAVMLPTTGFQQSVGRPS